MERSRKKVGSILVKLMEMGRRVVRGGRCVMVHTDGNSQISLDSSIRDCSLEWH